MKRRVLIFTTAAVVIAGLLAGGLWKRFLRPQLPPAERGRRLAERVGCFTCHGPGGVRGSPNPGRPYPRVPNFADDLMMYAKSGDEVREWIRDGVSSTKASSETWHRERDAGVLVMPAYGDRLSDAEIDDLVAYVMAIGRIDAPRDTLAARGEERARQLGCFGCHGSGGRLALPNPGSLKGYIPSWNGNDFPELVRDEAEFRQWVEKGVSDRFAGSAFARGYLERASVRMPPFEDHLQPGDVDVLWAYITWLRTADN